MEHLFNPIISKFQLFFPTYWPTKVQVFHNDNDKAVPTFKSEKISSLLGKKSFFFNENWTIFEIENLGTYFLIFHSFRNLASFSPHFWIIQWMLQPLIANGIITIIKIKTTLCV